MGSGVESEAWSKSANLLVRLERGGPNPRAIRVVAWHGPCHVAGAQWTLEETKMHYVPLSLGVFPAYLKYNPGTFLRFMRLYISCLPNSPLYIYDHSLPW